MDLNWTAEVISDFFIGISLFILTFILKNPISNRIKSLIFLRFVWIAGSIYFFLEASAYLLAKYDIGIVLSSIQGITGFIVAVFLLLAINYTFRESFTSVYFIPVFMVGALLCYSAFQPGASTPIIEYGILSINWTGLFNLLGVVITFTFLLSFFFWALIIWRNAPFVIKREATIFLVAAIFVAPGTLFFYLIQFWIPFFISVSNYSLLIGLLISNLIIRKEPKLLFVLPFIPYRLIVKDHSGALLFEHIWSKSRLNEAIFSRFLGAVQQMHQELISSGRSLDITLSEGIIIFYGSEDVLVVFVVSKPSKFLRELIKLFALEFEATFKEFLKESSIDPSKYESAKELLKKYFSIFPSRIIQDEKQQIFLSRKYVKIPAELEAKLRTVMKDQEEIEAIKCDIERSAGNISEEFLDLYRKLKDEIEEPQQEEPKESNKKDENS